MDDEKLSAPSNGESSADVRRRTQATRDIQQHRFSDTAILKNAQMGPNEVWQFCEVEDSAQSLIQTAMQQKQLSARAYHRILQVSRTIADHGGSDTIGVVHIAEFLQYRPTQWV
jgi:magnesium chelatase family protein